MKGGDRMYQEITSQTRTVVTELLAQVNLRPGSLFVVGCSSSEMESIWQFSAASI